MAENASAHGALAESRAKEHRLRQQLAETAAEQTSAEAELREASVEIHECIKELGGDAFVLTCAEVVMEVAAMRGEL